MQFLQHSLGEHQPHRLAVHREQHQKETRQAELHLAEARDSSADGDAQYSQRDCRAWHCFAEDGLHHHCDHRRETFQDLYESDREIHVRRVTRAQSCCSSKPNNQYVLAPKAPFHVAMLQRDDMHDADEDGGEDGRGYLVEARQQYGIWEAALRKDDLVKHDEHRADQGVRHTHEHGHSARYQLLPRRLTRCVLALVGGGEQHLLVRSSRGLLLF
mmetsp:Transcript_44485/g.110727  ORF Transcript_44485/g.110727 Transcript_44485/m.110727 type:complete len:215 (+) Transcript_44485:774-1418(+)